MGFIIIDNNNKKGWPNPKCWQHRNQYTKGAQHFHLPTFSLPTLSISIRINQICIPINSPLIIVDCKHSFLCGGNYFVCFLGTCRCGNIHSRHFINPSESIIDFKLSKFQQLARHPVRVNPLILQQSLPPIVTYAYDFGPVVTNSIM